MARDSLNSRFKTRPHLPQDATPLTINYYHWCVGGNGGLPRGAKSDEAAILDASGRKEIQDCYKKIGIATVDAPEEEFVVGKANYAKGIRAKNLTRTPLYRQ